MSNEFLNFQSFGINIGLPKNDQRTKKAIGNAVKSLWEPVMDYLKKNEDVFSGDIAKEIDRLNIQTMNLGFIAREGEEIHRLDTKG